MHTFSPNRRGGVSSRQIWAAKRVEAARPSPGRVALNHALALDSADDLPPLLAVMAQPQHYAECALALTRIVVTIQSIHSTRLVETLLGFGLQPATKIYRIACDVSLIPIRERDYGYVQTLLTVDDLVQFARGRKRRAAARVALHCLGFCEASGRTWIPFGEDGGRWPKDKRERAALILCLLVKRHAAGVAP